MDDLALTFALSRQVPAMERGFAISTSYGDLIVNAGPLAERIQTLVEQELRNELAQRERGQMHHGEVQP
jgi:hypothetical protein